MNQAASLEETLAQQIASLKDFLENSALPLWLSAGAKLPEGGFYERIGQDGQPILEDSRRARVQPRQAYCYATAGKSGWKGPWQEAVKSALEWFDGVYLLETGYYASLADAQGTIVDKRFDLYNQAFALFAFATLAQAFPESADHYHTRALALLKFLQSRFAHPLGGFEEADPPVEPLCSNPHMHLFEAALAWEEATEGEKTWSGLADEIANLALTRFIDPRTGALREFFNHDWQPHAGELGRVVEPGHQFEWAWLLLRWGEKRGDSTAIEKARRLFEIGETYGICPHRQVAVMSLTDDFSVHDGLARMWPQTEWLKASLKLATLTEDANRHIYLASASKAISAMKPFLDTPVSGLWYDKWPENGEIIDEPAPASTFYHIVCAIYEADAFLKAQQDLFRTY